MQPIGSFEELERFYQYAHHDNDQPYYFILLIKPYNTSKYFDVQKNFFDYIKGFHIHSGKGVDFFMPGYENDLVGSICGKKSNRLFHNKNHHDRLNKYVDIDGETYYTITIDQEENSVCFKEKQFNDFVRRIESFTEGRWKYKNQSELVLVKKDKENNRLDYSDTLIFNLEDIVRQGFMVSDFIDIVIELSKKYKTDKVIKRNIYLKYWELTSPNDENINLEYDHYCAYLFMRWYHFNEHYVFISYSFQDKEIAMRIKEDLNYHGVRVWIAPDSLPEDASYQYIIRKAIDYADAFLLVLSSNSNNSVWVEKETTIALNKKNDKKMIIYQLDGCRSGLHDVFKDVLNSKKTIHLREYLSSLEDETQKGDY